MAKQLACQKYIFKIHSKRLRENKWNLQLSLKEARNNDEIISLADSMMLRWIDELNGITDADGEARKIRRQINALRKQKNSRENTIRIRKLYEQLDAVQFKPDYMCLVIDKDKDYYRACRGFRINGVPYKRLLGTNGGIKNKTIVFVSERLHGELMRRIENDRDKTKELVTAKLEAYRALTCSASIPVSMPHGILVVDDVENTVRADIIYLNDDGVEEPKMEHRKNEEVTIDLSDGCGMMLPSLAKRWSEELGLDYMVSGVNTRFAWEKGMMFTFDFVEFAEKVAGSYIVKDAWGNDVDVRTVEAVFTTSQIKLWDSYRSCEHYLQCCEKNHYTFGIAKTTPEKLESERNLNYQFIQSYDLTEEDIEELIRPTIDEIHDIIRGDYHKTILYLKGIGLNGNNVRFVENDYAKAMMIEPSVLNDQYVQHKIYNMIKKRIDEAKVGVIKVHGNYSILSGDLYALCQNMFGMKVTGLLKAGEVYNRYWCGHEHLAIFRAPMTCHNNIIKVHPRCDDEVLHWYQYMTACTVLNGWDLIANSLNGCDFDGDLCMLTDNRVLVENIRETPSIMCVQRKAKKMIPNELDFVESNISSFGNSIGRTTNWITSMFEVQAGFERGSREYEELAYRIMCGQLYQQNEIDSAKGVIVKPMPKYWHSWHSVLNECEGQKDYQLSIVADKKPYFMRYIYPDLMRQYKKFVKSADIKSMRQFGIGVDALIAKKDRTEEQDTFVKYYMNGMPVGTNNCIMNYICRRFEDEFDSYFKKNKPAETFDYDMFRGDAEYTAGYFNKIKRLYDEYVDGVRKYSLYSTRERISDEETSLSLTTMKENFTRDCNTACPNEDVLCNILIDICYKGNSAKQFAWDICGDKIIENLLGRHGWKISYPELDENGDIEFGGNKFTYKTIVLEEV